MMTKPTFTEDPSTLPSNTELSCFGPAFIEPTHTKIPPPQAPLLLTMLHGWIYLLRSTLLALAWRSLLWLVICISTPLRIVWISIRLASLHYLSISNRGLSVLRIAWNIDMRRWWPIWVWCFHIHLLNLDSLDTPFLPFWCCQKGNAF